MNWIDIKHKHPQQFILIGNLIEKKLSPSKVQIVAGEILQVSDDPKIIRESYKKYKKVGQEVIFTLPSTPAEDLIIENIPFKGIFK